jgi:Fe-Mn family superoxide dismutase
MTMNFIKYLKEDTDTRELVQNRLKFDRDALEPVMSEATVNYHYKGLASKYSERYNAGEGDLNFNYGGAVLHNLFFDNLIEPQAANRPRGVSLEVVDSKWTSFDNFKQEFEKEAMAIQGSGWVYMDHTGSLNTIANHEYQKSMKIALLIDWWEHAWALDYQQDKGKYLKNIWRIIDWDVVNVRIQTYQK